MTCSCRIQFRMHTTEVNTRPRFVKAVHEREQTVRSRQAPVRRERPWTAAQPAPAAGAEEALLAGGRGHRHMQ